MLVVCLAVYSSRKLIHVSNVSDNAQMELQAHDSLAGAPSDVRKRHRLRQTPSFSSRRRIGSVGRGRVATVSRASQYGALIVLA
jgi:hypothetical protein